MLSDIEIRKIRELCFNNPAKACAFAQAVIDTVGVVSCDTFASVKGRSTRTVQAQASKLTGLQIEKRKFPAINQ